MLVGATRSVNKMYIFRNTYVYTCGFNGGRVHEHAHTHTSSVTEMGFGRDVGLNAEGHVEIWSSWLSSLVTLDFGCDA